MNHKKELLRGLWVRAPVEFSTFFVHHRRYGWLLRMYASSPFGSSSRYTYAWMH